MQTVNIPPDQKPKHEPVGPTVGIVIIIVLLLLGAFYFWGEQLNRQNKNPPVLIPAGNNAQQ